MSLAGSAQEVWTYSDCVDYAREHNISLQKLRLTEQTAEENLSEAKGQWQPTLDFATTQGYTNAPWGNGNKNAYNSSYGLNAGWTVWNGGVRENTIKRNEIQTEISRLDTEAKFRTLETDLLQVYVNILYAKEAIAICQQAEELSRQQAERARGLMESGKTSRVDYAQLNSQYEQNRYNTVNAVATYDRRRQELKQLLQLGIDTDIELAEVEWTAAQVLEALPPIDESYRLAIETDLSLQGLSLEKDASEYDVKIANAGRMPRLSLNAGVGTGYYAPGGSFGEGLKQSLNEQIGLTLSVPILDNKKTKTATAKARIQKMQTQLDINDRENALSQAVEGWYTDTRSAQARYAASEPQVEAARLSAELTEERFKLGYVNPVELLTANNAYTEAQHSRLQAKYMAILGQKMIEYYRTSTVNIN